MYRLPSWLPGAIGAAALAGYFLAFTGPGLFAGFTHDDLMNACGGWRHPISRHVADIILFFLPSPTHRPAGSLLYRVLYEFFGLNPFPYRAACYVLMVLNLGLAYLLAWRLSGLRLVGFAAAFLHSYHPEFWPLYSNTGMLYDLLCFFFYAAAFLYYLRWARLDPLIPWPRVAAWVALYALCLGSKEMAVSLPVVLACHAWLTSPPRWRPAALALWWWREGRIPLAGGVMTLLFVLGRVTAPQGLASVGAYHPAPSLEAYLAHGYHFLRETFCRAGWFSPPVAALLMLALAAAAWKWRSRLLTLCLVWMVTGILPLAFIPLRGLAAAYIPTFALALFAAAAYVRLTRARWPATAAVLLAVVALQIWRGPLDYTPITQTGRQIAALEAEIRASHLRLREDMRILILRDPFPDDDWSSTFFLQLASRTHGLSVRRLDHLLREPAASETLDFDLVLTYVDGRLHHCESAPFRRAPIASIEDLARNAACRPLAPSARAPRRPAPLQIEAAAEPSFAAAR